MITEKPKQKEKVKDGNQIVADIVARAGLEFV